MRSIKTVSAGCRFMVLDLLRRYPLFALLDHDHTLNAWASLGQEQLFATGETLFQEGTSGVCAFLILEGRVRVLRQGRRAMTLGMLGPGEVFGEYALLPPHRNTATCRSVEATRLLRLPLMPLRSRLAALPGVRECLKDWLRLHSLVSFLRDRSFLGFLSAPSALTFKDYLKRIRFESGNDIQADGLGGDCWYFIESGQVAVRPPETGGVPPRMLGPGDCFGEAALAGKDGLPRATAVTDVCVRCLRREDFAPARPRQESSLLQSYIPARPDGLSAYPWIGQEEERDCGLAALAMLAQFHGRAIGIETLRPLVRCGRRGLSLLQLRGAAASIGFRTQAVRVGPDQLAQVTLPAIVHLRPDHYAVLYDIGEVVTLADPASGIHRLTLSEFALEWTGVVLLARPALPD